jgi:membrane protease YdiL (CAAX protease family)
MGSFRNFISVFIITATLAGAISPLPAEAKLAPGVAGALSVVPGLGQVTNGDELEGLGWFAGVVGGMLFSSGSTSTIFLDLWMYNMYDAYRDAGAHRAAKHNLFENYIAGFNPLNFWGPYSTIPLVYQTAVVAGSGHGDMAIGPNNKALTPIYMGFIALGEEGLFRGFVFPGFTDLLGGSALLGAVTSSVTFAAAHAFYEGQATYALQPNVFIMRTVMGLFYSWQTYEDKYDLRKSIFSHTWFDVLYEWDRQGLPGGGAAPTGFMLKTQIPF